MHVYLLHGLNEKCSGFFHGYETRNTPCVCVRAHGEAKDKKLQLTFLWLMHCVPKAWYYAKMKLFFLAEPHLRWFATK